MLLKPRLGLALVSLVLLAACSSMQTAPRPTEPGKDSIVTSSKDASSFHVNDSEPPQVADKELDFVPPEMQVKVEQWIAYFQGKGRPHMERYLGRSTRHIQLMKRIMRQNGLPEDLVYVALIESGFSSRATSRAAAVGYWQFIKGTGRRYGLEINSFVDERRDPVLSTQAAAEYFKGLYSVFGSWYLAMASYNVGENRVKREVMNTYSRDFWELARKRRFPKETANYVPKFIAARLIGRNPEKYGFSDIDYDKPEEFELIKIDKPINLRAMAEKMSIDYEDLKQLNPKFRGEIAPLRDGGLELRVPVGQTQIAMHAAEQSISGKVEFVADAGETETYRVRSGDSLYTIARKYHTNVAWLRDVNDLKAGRKLRIGMRLQVPDSGGGRISAKKAKAEMKAAKLAEASSSSKIVAKTVAKEVAKDSSKDTAKSDNLQAGTEKTQNDTETAANNPELVTSNGVFYVVQSGDTLSSIADDYDSSISELRKMNKLGKGSMIRAGMKLKVPKDEGLPSDPEIANSGNEKPMVDFNLGANKNSTAAAPALDTVFHVVKAGENLTTIAKQYGVTVKEILEVNNLKRKTKITEGMTLTIPVKNKPSTSVDSKIRRLQKRKLAGMHLLRPAKKIYHSKIAMHSMRKKKHFQGKVKRVIAKAEKN